MPAVTTSSLSNDPYVNGVLGDVKWAVTTLTYSFPTSASLYGSSYGNGEPTKNFGAFNTTQQNAVRNILTEYSSVANMNFVEIAETTTQHADLRYAMSDAPSTAWAYFPTTAAEGGDSWFNKSGGKYLSPTPGNYAYATMLHETGHAMGLEHAHEAYAMPADRDSMEYTVMSYRSYVGAPLTGYTNETGGFAQSLMMYDIAALQHMYGANFTSRSGATTYSWSPTTGEAFIDGQGQGAPVANRIFETIWDGGGIDTYDFSNYATGLKISLQPGEWTTTSSAQLARLHYDGSKIAVGNIANALLYKDDPRSLIENAVGGTGDDAIVGNLAANSLKGGAGADKLTGLGGDDRLDGGDGVDTVVFTGLRAAYVVTQLADGSLQFTSVEGKDVAVNVERFQFSDGVFAASDLLGSVTTTPSTSGVTLAGDAGSNTLTGTAYADRLDGKAGADKLFGLEGDDLLTGGAGADALDGGAGVDAASYASATSGVTADLANASAGRGDAYGDTFVSIENLIGTSYADTLRGDARANEIWGGAGGDKLYGQAGADTLRGEAGVDYLYGGAGADALYGGADGDVFVFQLASDSTSAARDAIYDFTSGVDKIDLRNIDANTGAIYNQAFTFVGANGFSGRAGELNVVNGVASGDVNGDKIADFQILIAGQPALSASDFYL